MIVADNRLPLVSYRLAFRAGDAHDPRGLPGLTDLLTGLLTEGTESRTSREIADQVARMGATLQRRHQLRLHNRGRVFARNI